MYNKNLKELSRSELEYYANILQINLNLSAARIEDLEHRIDSLKKTNTKLMYRSNFAHYRKRAHTYKVELGRCRRKLTRIYKLFDKYILTVLTHYPLGSAESIFYIKCIEDMRKEIKNV